jgi:GNAT superfamily N-acetyltransferase
MITVKPLRDEAIDVGFKALAGRLPSDYSRQKFSAALEPWDVKAFCEGDEPVGMLMTRGAELHVAVLPEVRGKWLSRRLIRDVIGPIIRRHGEAKTSVMPDNGIGKDFVRRLGFIGEDIAVLREGFAKLVFDPVSATVAAGAAAGSGILSAQASKSAANTQANAANNATQAQLKMFDTINQQGVPYRQSGRVALGMINAGFADPNTATGPAGSYNYQGQTYGSLNDIRSALESDYASKSGGLDPKQAEIQASIDAALANATPNGAQGGINPGQFTHQFTADDLKTNLAPNYQFQLDQGLGAIKNAGNLQTGLISGNTLKGINDYAQNYAGGAYQQASRTTRESARASSTGFPVLLATGQGANQTTANAGTTLGREHRQRADRSWGRSSGRDGGKHERAWWVG